MKLKNALVSIAGTSLIFFACSASAQSQVPVAVGSTRRHLETLVAKLSCFMSLLLVVSLQRSRVLTPIQKLLVE